MTWIVRALVAAIVFAIAPGLGLAETNLVVRDEGDCPSARAVSEAAWAIRPDGEWPALTATVAVVADRIQITLGDDPRQQRELPVTADCAERARLVALVLAAWSGELPAHATDAPVLTAAVPAPEAAPLAIAASAPAPLPTKRSPMVAELGLAGSYSAVGDLVPGASVELGLFRREGWWGIRATGGYQSTRSRQVSMGESQYDRILLTAALVLQRNRPRVFHSCDVGLVGSYSRAHGVGYSQNQSSSGVNLAPMVEGRVGLRLGAYRLWAGVRVYRWLLEETLRVESLYNGLSSTATLPAWNAHLGLGASIVFD